VSNYYDNRWTLLEKRNSKWLEKYFMRKRSFLVFIMAGLFIVCLVAVLVACNNNPNDSDSDEENPVLDENITCEQDGNTYIVAPKSNDISGDITLPLSYKGKPTKFADFSKCSKITSITFLGDEEEISYFLEHWNRFYKIFDYDFNNIKNILPATIIYVGTTCCGYFGEMPKNYSVTINEGTTAISYRAFDGEQNLQRVVMPDSVIEISENAFSGCVNLADLVLSQNIEYIDYGAFYNTAWLNNQPDGIIYVGKTLFKYKGEMLEKTSIVVKDGTKCIASAAFTGCTSLVDITIPDSVARIGLVALSGTAWYDNQPDGVVYAGKVAYEYKGTMPENTSIIIKDGTKGIGERAFEFCSGLMSITIPDSVTSIGRSAFSRCEGLKSITIPDNLSSIGDSVFEFCSRLTDVTIPDSVTSIGENAFYGCSRLTSITIPETVMTIGWAAFSGCSGLTSITIPENVMSIGWAAFSGCSGLTSITVSNANNKFYSDGNCIIETDTKTLIAGCKTSVIPTDGSVTKIGCEAFSGCTGLTSITIPDSVTSIDEGAFVGCSSLTKIIIPDTVTSIGKYVFEDCSSLTKIYYKGTAEDWAKISIDSTNTNLTDVTRYYYSENPPTDSGNYWHYVDGVVTVWTK